MSISDMIGFPPEFYRTITLEVGIPFNDNWQNECTVGPETVKARHLAMAAKPDWIDLDEMNLALLANQWDELLEKWDVKKDGKKPTEKPQLTPEQIKLGDRMFDAWYELLALYRVVRLGAIPSDHVTEAALQLTRADVVAITKAAQEVDKFVAHFREGDQTGAGGKSAGGSGRPADESGTTEVL